VIATLPKRKGGLLKLINDFASINKHRRMLLTLLNDVAAETEFTSALGREVQTIVPTRNHATDVGIGPPMHVAEKVPVRSEAILGLVFDAGAAKGFEVSVCLGLLINEVGNEIIPKFERFFV
jgi:hypothetical protein